jgi:hypothetical protein
MSHRTVETHDRGVIAFRAPPALRVAIQAAADRDCLSASDIVRQALIRDLRNQGLLK